MSEVTGVLKSYFVSPTYQPANFFPSGAVGSAGRSKVPLSATRWVEGVLIPSSTVTFLNCAPQFWHLLLASRLWSAQNTVAASVMFVGENAVLLPSPSMV